MSNLKKVTDILSKLKARGLTDLEIASVIGVSERALNRWIKTDTVPYAKNIEMLVLYSDLVEAIAPRGTSNSQRACIRAFFSAKEPSLAAQSPGEYLLREGASAREALMLLAKNYAALDSLDISDYASMHLRLDLEILQQYNFDEFDLSEIIGKDRRRILELMTNQGKTPPPTRLETRQFRQAAAAAILLDQHHHSRAVKGLMFGISYNYEYKWRLGSRASIVEIIASQVEGDVRSYERAAELLGPILAKLTGKA